MVKFSIVIPNYNSAKWIKRCLDSILEQTYKDYEIIIVDDMSEDESIGIISSYKCQYEDKIKFIKLKEKKYNGGSRNIGVKNATGDYILFLDCDDYIYSKRTLQDLASFISLNPKDLIRLNYAVRKNKVVIIRVKETKLNELANSVFVAPWTKCIKREKFVPFPENTLLEDVVQHIAQVDNINTMANSGVCYAVWNRENNDAISSDTAKYNKSHKRYSSVYRNLADLLDLRCKHDYCEEQRQFRIRNYEDIIQKGDILGLINGVDR